MCVRKSWFLHWLAKATKQKNDSRIENALGTEARKGLFLLPYLSCCDTRTMTLNNAGIKSVLEID